MAKTKWVVRCRRNDLEISVNYRLESFQSWDGARGICHSALLLLGSCCWALTPAPALAPAPAPAPTPRSEY
ncbi:hypothetical protein M0802_007636 [Mischocyttarus mexicanus]|nr:hypothetical protein M0802_007636 [Mischocyttarus mexicanus]